MRALCSRPLLAVLLLMLAACFQLPAPPSESRYGDLSKEPWFPGNPQAQALALAAEHGDAKEIRRLIKDEGVNPDTLFTEDGMPLVAWPVFTGNPAGLKAMLENGADPNARVPMPLVVRYKDGSVGTYYKNNAMVWAAKADDPIYLKLLLDHGGDPNTRNSNDETLLKQARLMGDQWENVKLLVERGADVNAKSQTSTVVEMYAGLGAFMQAHWLLEHGATPTKHTVEAIYWRPTRLEDPMWQRRCQEWLLQRGYERPPMPKGMRKLREAYGFPTEEKDIPLL